eukprot:CAMPEP_0171400902 /NCGR_PEP_ID=MMETSP0880-20121228/7571_1 /TAXON_ID=67004 /ORGANISM="Thalassiosira weissflogii, Strain CCMP1336" /LENGTH=145 /DNA_ID=CAMNT_0011915307 /DNA_START=89 /DNA_END=526 /DNA_ORIENTATION=-
MTSMTNDDTSTPCGRIGMDSASRVNDVEERLNNEIQQLVKDIWRVGDPEKPQVPFGELFDDDDVQQHYEGLAATLKAAKKRGIVAYKSPILLKGAHDKVVVSLVDPPATSPLASGATKSFSGEVGSSDLEELKMSGLSAKEKIGA